MATNAAQTISEKLAKAKDQTQANTQAERQVSDFWLNTNLVNQEGATLLNLGNKPFNVENLRLGAIRRNDDAKAQQLRLFKKLEAVCDELDDGEAREFTMQVKVTLRKRKDIEKQESEIEALENQSDDFIDNLF